VIPEAYKSEAAKRIATQLQSSSGDGRATSIVSSPALRIEGTGSEQGGERTAGGVVVDDIESWLLSAGGLGSRDFHGRDAFTKELQADIHISPVQA